MGAIQQWLFKTSEEPAVVEKTLFHEIQQFTIQHLERLVPRVRDVKSAEDCFRLQEELLGLIYQVEEIELEASRKLRGGYDLSIRAEQWAAGRGARQLRTIGDAMAWMVTGGDRRAIAALSQNDGPARIYGKGEKGLRAEFQTVNAFWQQGHFALLHDLTNCLRIDDLTVCNRLHRQGVPDDHPCPPDEFSLVEIKSNHRARPSQNQKARHEAAAAAINEGADIHTTDGIRKQFRWSGGYENHEEALGRVLDNAMADGVAGEQIEEGWVVTAVRFVDWKPGTAAKDIIGTWERKRAELLDKANMRATPVHRLQTGDSAGRILKCIPFSLYPMEPRAVAFLTGDWLMFDSTLSIEYFESRLNAAGMKTERLSSDGAVLSASVGNHAIQLHRASVEHALAELVKIDVLARALRDWAAEPGFVGDGELILAVR